MTPPEEKAPNPFEGPRKYLTLLDTLIYDEIRLLRSAGKGIESFDTDSLNGSIGLGHVVFSIAEEIEKRHGGKGNTEQMHRSVRQYIESTLIATRLSYYPELRSETTLTGESVAKARRKELAVKIMGYMGDGAGSSMN